MNPFLPKNCPFEILGYYEEFIDMDVERRTLLGYRTMAEPDRPIGAPGHIFRTLTENVELRKGLKTVTVKASPKRPRRVGCMIQILCGREKKRV